MAPFAEFGVPFANSARERRIRDLLDIYKSDLAAYTRLLGGERLRGWFAELPLEERVAIARDHLGMYRGRADADEATAKRMRDWERGGEIGLAEAALVTIVQIARGWSDADMAAQAGIEARSVRDDSRGARRGSRRAGEADLSAQHRRPACEPTGSGRASTWMRCRRRRPRRGRPLRAPRASPNSLTTTIVGLYSTLTDWYLRAGEGRVETIKAVIDAERAVRPVSGVIVFDAGKRIRWRQGLTAPGYEGVAGLFAPAAGR